MSTFPNGLVAGALLAVPPTSPPPEDWTRQRERGGHEAVRPRWFPVLAEGLPPPGAGPMPWSYRTVAGQFLMSGTPSRGPKLDDAPIFR
jgi:hypothetical protein